ncbi:MAG: hypothetical protein MJ196_07570 [Treponemataceae bacterium]|nr:hypothetical protein [Treponemataceae bacterium]
MTIESIIKSTMAKEIEDKLGQLDLSSMANKKAERYVKKFVKECMDDIVRREVSYAVKQYLDSWQGKQEIARAIASMIKVSVKEETK